MIDTLAATIGVEGLDEGLFDRVSISRAMDDSEDEMKRYYNVRSTVDPALTYFPMTRAGPRLRVEVSLPKLLGLPIAILGQDDVDRALVLIDDYMRSRGLPVPPVSEWVCRRWDICYAWPTGDLTPVYIAALSKMQCSTYQRVPFGPSGVVWKSAKGYRWVKFYDKRRELGYREGGVLRFEVSNYRNGVKYVAKKRYKVPQTVGRMTRRDLVQQELEYWLARIGVLDAAFGSEDRLMQRLVEEFGTRSAPTALYFLTVFRQHGIDAYKEPLNLMTQSTFYRWRSKLIAAGLLLVVDGQDVEEGRALQPLTIPGVETFGLETFGGEWGDRMPDAA